MPRESFKLPTFEHGIISSPDARDLPKGAAIYSKNIDGVTKEGVLRGIQTDEAMALTSPPMKALHTSANGIVLGITDGSKALLFKDFPKDESPVPIGGDLTANNQYPSVVSRGNEFYIGSFNGCTYLGPREYRWEPDQTNSGTFEDVAFNADLETWYETAEEAFAATGSESSKEKPEMIAAPAGAVISEDDGGIPPLIQDMIHADDSFYCIPQSGRRIYVLPANASSVPPYDISNYTKQKTRGPCEGFILGGITSNERRIYVNTCDDSGTIVLEKFLFNIVTREFTSKGWEPYSKRVADICIANGRFYVSAEAGTYGLDSETLWEIINGQTQVSLAEDSNNLPNSISLINRSMPSDTSALGSDGMFWVSTTSSERENNFEVYIPSKCLEALPAAFSPDGTEWIAQLANFKDMTVYPHAEERQIKVPSSIVKDPFYGLNWEKYTLTIDGLSKTCRFMSNARDIKNIYEIGMWDHDPIKKDYKWADESWYKGNMDKYMYVNYSGSPSAFSALGLLLSGDLNMTSQHGAELGKLIAKAQFGFLLKSWWDLYKDEVIPGTNEKVKNSYIVNGISGSNGFEDLFSDIDAEYWETNDGISNGLESYSSTNTVNTGNVDADGDPIYTTEPNPNYDRFSPGGQHFGLWEIHDVGLKRGGSTKNGYYYHDNSKSKSGISNFVAADYVKISRKDTTMPEITFKTEYQWAGLWEKTGGYCYYGDRLYRFNTNHFKGWKGLGSGTVTKIEDKQPIDWGIFIQKTHLGSGSTPLGADRKIIPLTGESFDTNIKDDMYGLWFHNGTTFDTGPSIYTAGNGRIYRGSINGAYHINIPGKYNSDCHVHQRHDDTRTGKIEMEEYLNVPLSSEFNAMSFSEDVDRLYISQSELPALFYAQETKDGVLSKLDIDVAGIVLTSELAPLNEAETTVWEDEHGSDTVGFFDSTKRYYYTYSFMYNGNQESPLNWAATGTPGQTDGNTLEVSFGDNYLYYDELNVTIKIYYIDKNKSVFENDRLTGINIYRSENHETDASEPTTAFTLVKELQLGMDWEWSKDLVGPVVSFTVTDNGIQGASYESLVGVPQLLGDTSVTYSTAVVAEGELIVCGGTDINGNFVEAQNSYWERGSKNILFKSEPDRFSIFDVTSNFLQLPRPPHSLWYFDGRVYAFGRDFVSRINPMLGQKGMVLEEEWTTLGAIPNFVCQTEQGLYFADNVNVYFFDGKSFTRIGDAILRTDSKVSEHVDRTWSNLIRSPDYHFRQAYQIPTHSSVVFPFEKSSDKITISWVYNYKLKRWDMWEKETFSSKLLYDGHVYSFPKKTGPVKRMLEGGKTMDWEWCSKKFTFDDESNKKLFHKLNIMGDLASPVSASERTAFLKDIKPPDNHVATAVVAGLGILPDTQTLVITAADGAWQWTDGDLLYFEATGEYFLPSWRDESGGSDQEGHVLWIKQDLYTPPGSTAPPEMVYMRNIKSAFYDGFQWIYTLFDEDVEQIKGPGFLLPLVTAMSGKIHLLKADDIVVGGNLDTQISLDSEEFESLEDALFCDVSEITEQVTEYALSMLPIYSAQLQISPKDADNSSGEVKSIEMVYTARPNI